MNSATAATWAGVVITLLLAMTAGIGQTLKLIWNLSGKLDLINQRMDMFAKELERTEKDLRDEIRDLRSETAKQVTSLESRIHALELFRASHSKATPGDNL